MSTTRSTASVRPPATAEGEVGTALVGTLVGATIFVVLLLFSAQVLLRLYATSALSAAAYDAARQVAQSPSAPAAAESGAQAAALRQLGGFGRATHFSWLEADGRQVVLTVSALSPGLLPLPSSWRTITRTVVVRVERVR